MLRLRDFRTIPLTSSVAFILSVIAMPQAVLQFDRNNAGVNVIFRVTDSNNAKVAAEGSLQGSGILDRTGSTNEMQTRHKEAEAAFRKATALDEKFGEAHLNLGHLLIVLKRRSEAAIELRRGLHGREP